MAAAVGRIVRMYVMYIFVYKFGRAFCLMSKQNTRVGHTTLIARVLCYIQQKFLCGERLYECNSAGGLHVIDEQSFVKSLKIIIIIIMIRSG